MNFLLSAKGRDITTWRAAQDFASRYRQSVLDRAVSGDYGSAETVYAESLVALKASTEADLTLMNQLNNLLEKGASNPPFFCIKEMSGEYYDVLYRHLDTFNSAYTFYKKSMDFLKMLCCAAMAHTTDQLGLFARYLPKMDLIALGTAGRCEYSPFDKLQLLLVHGETTPAQIQTINLFCHTLHSEIEACGLSLDPIISPRNPEWRGSIAIWEQRCKNCLSPASTDDLINVARLTDLYPLTPSGDVAQALKTLATGCLRATRPTQTILIAKMESLSNGIGMMGGFKLERSGAERGLFNLRQHGLLPLSSALSALALIKGSTAISSSDRILNLLERRELDVDLAEKMLETWHYLHELHLGNERGGLIAEQKEQSLFLNTEEMTTEQRQSLKTALISVNAIQRHVGITLSGMGEHGP